MTPFLLLTTQRTGSTWLIDLLNSHPRMTAYSELFIAGGDGYPRWGGARDRVFWETWSRQHAALPEDRRLTEYLEQVFSARPGAQAVGCKVMYEQMGRLRQHMAWLVSRQFHFVHLVRGNLLDIVVSRYAAEQQGRYHMRVGETLNEEKVILNVDTLRQELTDLQQRVADARRRYSAYGCPYAEFSYESLCTNADTLPELLRFLQVDPPDAPLQSSLQRMNLRAHDASIENFAEVCRALRDTPYYADIRHTT